MDILLAPFIYKSPNDVTISEKRNEKDEGTTYCALLRVMSQHLPRGAEERHNKFQPEMPVNIFIAQTGSVTAIFGFFSWKQLRLLFDG